MVPQKVWYGEKTERHDIRLDIYLDEEDGEIFDMDPGLSYEDGERTIFLYTKGTEGKPPEELLHLARYMEHSIIENTRTSGLIRLYKMGMEVKSDREVGLAYMKAFEIDKRIREESREEGEQ